MDESSFGNVLGWGVLPLLALAGLAPHTSRDDGAVFLCSTEHKAELLRAAAELGLDISGVQRRTETLEELYMKHLGGSSDG